MSKQVLFIIRTKPHLVDLQNKILSIIQSVQKDNLVKIFFMDDSVSICSTHLDQIESLKEIQNQYKKLNIELLVCGRALKDRGLSIDEMDKNFIMSGNMELSSLIASFDKVIQL